MIEISLGKMVLLALIALIVLGPEKLPGAARTAGALLRRVRSGWDNVRAEVERELEIEQIKRSAREAVAGAEAAQQQVKDTLKQAHDPFAEAAAMVRLQPGSLPVSVAPTKRAALAVPPAGSAIDTLQPGAAATATALKEVALTGHAQQPDGRAAAAQCESVEGLQAELPLDTAQVDQLARKDGQHGNA